jgi:hypothetical protein
MPDIKEKRGVTKIKLYGFEKNAILNAQDVFKTIAKQEIDDGTAGKLVKDIDHFFEQLRLLENPLPLFEAAEAEVETPAPAAAGAPAAETTAEPTPPESNGRKKRSKGQPPAAPETAEAQGSFI